MFDLVYTLGDERGQVLDVDADVGALLQLKPHLRVLVQKISNLLLHSFHSLSRISCLINLEVAGSDEVLLVVGLGNVLEDVFEGVVDDSALLLSLLSPCTFLSSSRRSLTLHGVGLARAGLSIGEDGSIEAFKDRVDEISK